MIALLVSLIAFVAGSAFAGDVVAFPERVEVGGGPLTVGDIAVIDSDYVPGQAPKGEAVILERSVPPFPEVPEVPAE